MSAYLVVTITLHESEWVQKYVAEVPAIIRKHGGEYLAVSKRTRVFEGDLAKPDQIALFTFPSLDAIEHFMNCDEYRPFKEARVAQSSANILGFSV